MISYRVENIEDSVFIVRENENGTFSWIPSDPNNSDYKEYLKWLEGNNVKN